LLFATPGHSQQLLQKVSSLDIYDDHLQNMYVSDSLLFVLRADWDNPNGFSTNIYHIADPVEPYFIGRQQKEIYEGAPEFQNRVQYFRESGLQFPFFAILSEDKTEVLHYFWYPNKVMQNKSYFYEFKSFDPEVKIYQIQSPGKFQLINHFTLSIPNPVFSGLAVVDDVIYLTTKNAGLILLDVTDIHSIHELAGPLTGENLTQIICGNQKAWIEKDSGEIIVLNVSNPGQPEIDKMIAGSDFHLTGFWQDEHFILKKANEIAILDPNFEVISSREGFYTDSFVKKNSILIVSSTRGIEIFNTSDGNLSRLSRISKYRGEAFHFTKKENYLFIADFADGLTIIDIADPQQPRLLSRYYLDGNAMDVQVSGDYAYIADYVNGLFILDISQPENPVLVSGLKIEGGAKSLDLMGDTLFLLSVTPEDGGSVSVINIANKLMPEIIHQENVTPADPWLQWYSTDNLRIAGGYIWCYVDCFPLFAFHYDSVNGLVQKAQFGKSPQTGWGWGNSLAAFDHFMFFITETGIRIIDMRNLTFILKESGFAGGALSEMEPLSVALLGDTLIVSMGYMGGGGLAAYDLKDPAHPVELVNQVSFNDWSREIIFEDDNLSILKPFGIEIFTREHVNNIHKINDAPFIACHLFQNYPNPFNASTAINYVISESATVSVEIYNLTGKKVRTLYHGYQNHGTHQLIWDGKNDAENRVPSGVYFCKIKLTDKNKILVGSRKLILLK
jgi:hypothetical protein